MESTHMYVFVETDVRAFAEHALDGAFSFGLQRKAEIFYSLYNRRRFAAVALVGLSDCNCFRRIGVLFSFLCTLILSPCDILVDEYFLFSRGLALQLSFDETPQCLAFEFAGI